VLRLPPILVLAAAAGGLLLALGASAAGTGDAAARAYAVQVTVPGGSPAGTEQLTAPGNAVASDDRYAYPSDGSVVSVDSTTVSVSTGGGDRPAAESSAALAGVSLFGGEIAASSVTGEARSLASAASASGEPGTSGIDGLSVLGRRISPAPGARVELGWGTLTLLAERGDAGHGPASGFDEVVTALDVVLTAAHGGLPAGAEIRIGYAEAWARSTAPIATASIPTITVSSAAGGKPAPQIPTVKPKLGEGGYVFPVYGRVAFGDTFGADRPDVAGGWHHGDDIFAPLGTPLLAVAHGVVFSVGWEKVGGWRLWLRDDVGNEFYYAHLSAYSPLAMNGAIVNAGDVLGFVGDTGDAEGTPSHLHFEIHPVGLLERGYDGAVDPTSYLGAWRRLTYLRYASITGWTPRVVSVHAPKAGAVLLQSTDISSASGLDPAALGRVVSAAVSRSRPGT
jgi:murein DD-endopeptidase MepM/ murein hydrolase activator NlpD